LEAKPEVLPSAQTDAIIALAKAPPPKSEQSGGLLILVSLAAFVLLGRQGQTLGQIALLVLVLFFHEAGHIAGMHLFGYSDLRVLFVPFVGALATGRKVDAPAWQRGVVLLLGPLPGLLLSAVLLSFPVSGIARSLAIQLLLINGLNLLPLYPLDGGGFVQQLFASRPRVQVALSAAGLAGVALLAWYANLRILLGIAVLLLLGIPVQLRLARESAAMRAEHGAIPKLADLSDEALRELFARALRSSRVRPPRPKTIAQFMQQIHDRARIEPMKPGIAVALVAAYFGGFVLLFLDVLLLRAGP
jgi:Zn-dependent protease